MSLGTFLIMRHELLLIAAALLVLIAEIFWNPDKKRSISLFSIILLVVITIIGFLPSPAGSLFGGMYISSGSRLLMKNILNIGALLVFIQSVTWLKKEENSEKISEYFLIAHFNPCRNEFHDFSRSFFNILYRNRTGYNSNCSPCCLRPL